MKKILVFILLLIVLPQGVSAQGIKVSKSVSPGELLVGEETTVSISIQTNETQMLQVEDKLSKAFELVSVDEDACSYEVEPLTEFIIVRCDTLIRLAGGIEYKVRAVGAGVYYMPEATVITESGERISSKDLVEIRIGVTPVLPTTEPPVTKTPPPTPTTSGFNPKAFFTSKIESIRTIIESTFSESVRFLALGVFLFLVILLVFTVPFYVYLRKKRE